MVETTPVKGSELQTGDRILSRHPDGEIGRIEVSEFPGRNVIVAIWEPPLGGIAGDTMLNPAQEFQKIVESR